MAKFILILSLLFLHIAQTAAAPEFGAELRIQQQALFAPKGDLFERVVGDAIGVTHSSLRLKASGTLESFSYTAHYVGEATYSARYEELESLTPRPRALSPIDLQDTLVGGSDGQVVHRLDRLWLTHTTPKTVVRLGRQALSWGHGQVFQPLDLFNPFAPDALDTSYKPGTDMIYGQYLLENGADIQALIVPRKRTGGGLSSEVSSFAMKGFWMMNSLELEVVAASDYGDEVFALGGSRPIGDAVWKFDLVSTIKNDGGVSVSAVTSLETSWDWNDRPVTGFTEYYRNGFGIADRGAASDLPEDLTERIARGQLFNTGRDYLAFGARIDWTPLLTLSPTMILNVNDASSLAILEADYSLSDNSSLVAGAQFPMGRRRSEFGGRAVSIGAPVYSRRPTSLFLRFERYF